MQFQRLRLVGFKSFVDPAEVHIEPGLTGVVGPNGCGKSNVLEGLRWVMGANSAKAMRGQGMDDVIFAGAADRPPRSHAEVQLTIDNAQRRAPQPFTDSAVLEVSRRIDRGQGFDLSHQRQGGARPRRATAVRRRLDRGQQPGPGTTGPDQRTDRRQAAEPPPYSGRGRGRGRAAHPSP